MQETHGDSRPIPVLKLLSLAALAVFCSGTARAESPVFYEPDMELGFFWQQRDLLLQGDALDDDEMSASFDIRQQGYWSDPRIVSFNYFLRPVYSVRDYTPLGQQDVKLLNYTIGIDVLRGALAPVEVRVQSSLSDNDYQATLAGDTVSRTQEHSAELRWKFAPFPMQFNASERSYYRKSTSIFSESAIERDELHRKFRIRGKSSKLSMTLVSETRENQLDQRVSDLEHDTANLVHRIGWGRKSYLRSRYEYRRRAREQEYISSVFSQLARVQHTESFDSELDYRFESAKGLLNTDVLDARYALNHQLYQNLFSSVSVYSRDRTSDNEDFSQQGYGIELDYSKTFFGTAVNIGADFRSLNIDQKTEEGFLEIFDEAYTIPPDGKFVLSNRLVNRESVTITDNSGGIVYIRGIDYQLLELGNALIIVDIIPGGDMEPGQSVLASYNATQNPSGEYRETLGSYNVSISRGGLFFSHYALRTDNDLISGFLPSELVRRREIHTQLDYSWETGKGDFQLGVNNDLWQNTDFKLDSWTLSGSAIMSISPTATASLTLTHQETETEDHILLVGTGTEGDKLDTVFDNVRLDLDWRPTNFLTITPSVTAWKRKYDYLENDSRSWKEDVTGAEIELDYQFRKFSANLRVFYNDWEIRRLLPGSDNLRTDDGFQLTVRRAF